MMSNRLHRRSSLDFVTDLVNDVPNTLEILTHVPFGITLYSTEGRALVRNAEARRQFEGLPPDPHPGQGHSQFLPHVSDRETAEQILVFYPFCISIVMYLTQNF